MHYETFFDLLHDQAEEEAEPLSNELAMRKRRRDLRQDNKQLQNYLLTSQRLYGSDETLLTDESKDMKTREELWRRRIALRRQLVHNRMVDRAIEVELNRLSPAPVGEGLLNIGMQMLGIPKLFADRLVSTTKKPVDQSYGYMLQDATFRQLQNSVNSFYRMDSWSKFRASPYNKPFIHASNPSNSIAAESFVFNIYDAEDPDAVAEAVRTELGRQLENTVGDHDNNRIQ